MQPSQDHSTSFPLSSVPSRGEHDRLSDTGVMRILGECPPPSDTTAREDVSALRSCPLCSRHVPEASTVCSNCSCYLGPSPDYLRSMKERG